MPEKAGYWAIVELMGHVRMAGFLTEEEQFGAKMGRLDIPRTTDPECECCKGKGQIPSAFSRPGEEVGLVGCPKCGPRSTTTFFGGQSVYRITPCTEEAARAVAKSNQPTPVHSWELPRLPGPSSDVTLTPARRVDDEDDYDDEDDEDDQEGNVERTPSPPF